MALSSSRIASGRSSPERWKLPEVIVRCVRYHHEPGQLEPSESLVDTVYLANSVCLLLGIGLGSDGLSYRANDVVMHRYNLEETDLEIVGVQMMTELKGVEQTFSDTFGAVNPALAGAK